MGQKQLPVEASCGPDSAQTPALKPASAEGGGSQRRQTRGYDSEENEEGLCPRDSEALRGRWSREAGVGAPRPTVC